MPTISSERFALHSAKPPQTTARPIPGVVEDKPSAAPLQVVLYQPEIPQNTGNAARTCAATRTPLHLVEPLGFRLTDRHLKRAGLDYWPHVRLNLHPSLESLRLQLPHHRFVCFSSHAPRNYLDFHFSPGDCLIFGSESKGLPDAVLTDEASSVVCIPVDHERVRSLNLATAVGVALFEAIRQLTSGSLESSVPFFGTAGGMRPP